MNKKIIVNLLLVSITLSFLMRIPVSKTFPYDESQVNGNMDNENDAKIDTLPIRDNIHEINNSSITTDLLDEDKSYNNEYDKCDKKAQEQPKKQQENVNLSNKQDSTNMDNTDITTNTYDEEAFVSRWNTSLTSDVSSAENQIKLPLQENGDYAFTVEWGDGTNHTITTWNQSEIIHNYTTPGVYTLVISGKIEGWRFTSEGDKLKILEISQWGTLQFRDGGTYYFGGCENLVLTATDAPDLTQTTSLNGFFSNCPNLGDQGDMSLWDTSNITNMKSMFKYSDTFNQNVSTWDTSKVTTMQSMFYHCYEFNYSLEQWDVSNVKYMAWMFANAWSFNQPLNTWNTSRVMDMAVMFASAINFNQPLDTWNTSRVNDMTGMFANCLSFDQNLGMWNIEILWYAEGMFTFCSLSVANYDALLIGWAAQDLSFALKWGIEVKFHGGYSEYSEQAVEARNKLINTYKWEITDGGLYDDTPPVITEVNHTPVEPTEEDTLTINATVTDNVALEHITLYYAIDNQNWQNTSMVTYGISYTATIGPFPVNTTLSYYIYTEDTKANNASSSIVTVTISAVPEEPTPPPTATDFSFFPFLSLLLFSLLPLYKRKH